MRVRSFLTFYTWGQHGVSRWLSFTAPEPPTYSVLTGSHQERPRCICPKVKLPSRSHRQTAVSEWGPGATSETGTVVLIYLGEDPKKLWWGEWERETGNEGQPSVRIPSLVCKQEVSPLPIKEWKVSSVSQHLQGLWVEGCFQPSPSKLLAWKTLRQKNGKVDVKGWMDPEILCHISDQSALSGQLAPLVMRQKSIRRPAWDLYHCQLSFQNHSDLIL